MSTIVAAVWSSVLSIAYIAPYVLLWMVGLPPRPRKRVSVRSRELLVLPRICVITGKPAIEQHQISRAGVGPSWVEYDAFPLPFSSAGWIDYCDHFPRSLQVFNGGIGWIVHRMGFFGAPFAFLWVVFAGFVCGLAAIPDLVSHRRPLVKIHGVRRKVSKEGVYGIDMTVTNEASAAEFARLYPQASIDKKWWQVWK